MKIIQPSATLIRPHEGNGIICLRFIEQMGRISHKSEDKQTEDSWKRFIEAHVIQQGDWSVVEHASATVIFRVDRGITHELVRHRLFSFTQESTRFVNGSKSYPEGLEFICPIDLENKGWKIDVSRETAEAKSDLFIYSCAKAESDYLSLLHNGARPQEARSILPNALASTIGVTGNLRNWRWFFLARTTKESHPDMRRVTIPLLEQFKQRIPLLYDDIEPNQKQSISMSKVH